MVASQLAILSRTNETKRWRNSSGEREREREREREKRERQRERERERDCSQSFIERERILERDPCCQDKLVPEE